MEDPAVAGAEDHEEDGADGCADDVAYAGQAIEAIPERTAGGGDYDAREDDNGAVAEGKECADRGGPPAGGDEATGGEVNGGDVVCIEGVAEAEGVGEGCGRSEAWVGEEDG